MIIVAAVVAIGITAERVAASGGMEESGGVGAATEVLSGRGEVEGVRGE